MHHQVSLWFNWVLGRFPQYRKNVDVIDFGSLDINGNNRQFFTPKRYTGVDIVNGKNVDVVSYASKYKHDGLADVVISTEMLEHDKTAKASFLNMIKNLRSGGLLIMTCAGEGRAVHGTRNDNPQDSPLTNDFYENVTLATFAKWLDFDSVFAHYEINKDGTDFRFFGITK